MNKIIKRIKNNKEAIVVVFLIITCLTFFLKFRKENFKTLVKNINRGVYTGGSATRNPDAQILKIEKAHKCNRAGCATRETKQKKHIY